MLCLISHVWLFATPWTVAHQVPLSRGILQARILEWVAMPSSRGSSQPRDRTQVSRIADGFFTTWATRKAHEYWCGQPIPSPGDLPDPGIELGSPTLQVDSLPAELSGKPHKGLHSEYFKVCTSENLCSSHLLCCSGCKVALDKIEVNACGCVSIKLYLKTGSMLDLVYGLKLVSTARVLNWVRDW